MSLTTEQDSSADLEPVRETPESAAKESGYDVIHSAASPQRGGKPVRWDSYLLFNVAVPILLLVASVAVFRALPKPAPAPVPPPPSTRDGILRSLDFAYVAPVQTLEQTGKDLNLVVDGTVVPFREARIASEVAGRITKKSAQCEAGALVRKGEVLMEIDSTDYQKEVERLEKMLEQESLAIAESRQEEENAETSIEIAQQDVALKLKEKQRQDDLLKVRGASKTEVERAESSWIQARQQLVSLENQLRLVKKRQGRLEASRDLAQTQLEVAQINLDRCVIKAPIDGVVVSEEVDLDTFVARGALLVTIEDISRVEVSANLRMDQLLWIIDQDRRDPDLDVAASSKELERRAGYDLPNTPATIEFEIAGRDSTVYKWQGELVSFDGIGLDTRTRTVPVRVIVKDPTHYQDADGNKRQIDRVNALMRGMFVRVRLNLAPTKSLVVLPASAMRAGNRVLAFQPDESQLTAMVVEAKQAQEEAASAQPAAEGAPQPETSPAETPESEDSFDPSVWTPGLVTYTKAFYPVDSLQLGDRGGEEDDELSGDKYWICEAPKGFAAGPMYVVTSPLSVPPEGLYVRSALENDQPLGEVSSPVAKASAP